MRLLCAGIGTVLLASSSALSAQAENSVPVTLQPAGTIIVPAASRPAAGPDHVGDAAKLLQEYLRKAYGVTTGFEIVPEAEANADGGTVILALGPTKWADAAAVKGLWQDGFVIRRTGHVISIRGGKERGTYHGALEFLSRFAGVRFYMPGDLWTSLPKAKAVEIPAQVEIRSEPFVKGTSMTGLNWPAGAGAWAARNAVNTRSGLAGTHQHNMNNLFPPERFAAKYPELYPIIDGKRYHPRDARDQKWNPCFTSPQTLAAAEKAALEYFQKNPDHFWVSMGLQDSHTHCECERCQAEFAKYEKECAEALAAGNQVGLTSTYTATPEGSKDDLGRAQAAEKWSRPYALSQLQWRLLNDLAKRLETSAPGKWVEALAYGITSFAPTIKLHPNVMLFAQIHVSDDVRGLMEPRPDGSLPIDRFIDASTPFGNHEWYRGEGYLAPRIYSGYWTKFMRHLKEKGKTMTFQHAEAYPNWGMDGPKYWVLARTWWNPDQDPAALWRQFCDDMFGAGAEPMFQYFRTLEQWYMDQSAVKGPKWKINGYAGVFQRTPEDMKRTKECRAHLEEAKRRVRTEEERQRVHLFDKTFRVTEYLVELGTGEAPPERAEELRRHFREQILPDPMTIGDRMRLQDGFIDNVIAGVMKRD